MNTSKEALLNIRLSRLLQSSFSQAINECYGNECIDKISYMAGEIAGITFFTWCLKEIDGLELLIGRIKVPMEAFGIKALNLDDIYIENETIVLVLTATFYLKETTTTSEISFKYEEGVIAAFLSIFTGRSFNVSVIENRNNYEANCRFQANMA